MTLIRKAKECSTEAVKFQAYMPNTLTINADNKYFQIKHPKWGGQTLYELARVGSAPIAVAVAENQLNDVLGWQKTGFIEYAGWCEQRGTLEKILGMSGQNHGSFS